MSRFMAFLAGLFVKHSDRVRGSGWLDCPNCHEHASQDVIDRMTFVALVFYRLAPVRRQRVLRCRRCNFIRPADQAALRELATGGAPIRAAWMAPIGLIGLLATCALVWFFIASSQDILAKRGISFHTISGGEIAPAVKLDVPNTSANTAWILSYDKSFTPLPAVIAYETSGTDLHIYVQRIPTGGGTLSEILETHYKDQTGINDQNVPSEVPAGTCTTIGSEAALTTKFRFKQSGRDAEIILYAVQHDGVGYLLTFAGVTGDGISALEAIAEHVIGTVSFTTAETPEATPTPSPTPKPARQHERATPSASPSAAAAC